MSRLKGKTAEKPDFTGESPEEEILRPAWENEEEEAPAPAKIKEKIMRRVYETIDTCSDPKKLMDVYETLTKLETETTPRESIFDIIRKKLEG